MVLPTTLTLWGTVMETFKGDLTFEAVDKILQCNHSKINESSTFETKKLKAPPPNKRRGPVRRLFEEFRLIIEDHYKATLKQHWKFLFMQCSSVHSDYISPLAH